MMNKKIVAVVTSVAMAAAVFTIVGANSGKFLAQDNGRNIQASEGSDLGLPI